MIIFSTFYSIGKNVKQLIDRPDGTYCFREQNNKVYYVSEKVLKLAENLGRDRLVSVGCAMGKFSKTNKYIYAHMHSKFCLNSNAIKFNIKEFFDLRKTNHFKFNSNWIHFCTRYKIWLKSSAEQQFLYGNHISKSGLGRISENTPKYQGVVVYSMHDLPLGFGVTARSTAECKVTDPLTTVCFHQADIGEYIRSEETLF